MRLPYAAKTLIAQVTEGRPRVKVTWGEPDGLGVVRSIRFSRGIGGWLEPLLDAIDDPRIIALDLDQSGFTVTFTAGVDADRRTPFPLDAAAVVRQ